MSQSFAQLFPERYAILDSHPLSTLRKEVTKSNIPLSVNHKRLSKDALINLMLAHDMRFAHITPRVARPARRARPALEPAPAPAPARRARRVPAPKKTPEEVKEAQRERGRQLGEKKRESARLRRVRLNF
jgi:hypothetical protein